ncbi:MAG: 6,7-dimethyl-8-ribityllumazine synthase [Phycisphaeraceae bacterium]|nr:MAG: 6,7-dimethyl-8-ribityllumazine synthase [Phycisphaeraceae bacterium]
MARNTSLQPVAVIVSRYNASVTDRLREGARSAYAARGGRGTDLHVFSAPGAYELPVLAREAALSGRYAGVVTLGCVIRGQTRHDRYIAQAVADALMSVALGTGVPVAFGVITAETAGQARDRASGKKGNKGEEAMNAVLDTIETLGAIARGEGGGVVGGRAPDKAASDTSASRLGKTRRGGGKP